MTVHELLEIETIRRARMRYSYYLDTGDLDALVALFTDDAVCEFGPYGVWTGKATIAENYAQVVGGAIREHGPFQTLHVNTNHWVELTGPDAAVGRLYLVDLALGGEADKNPMVWLGVYDEVYRKIDGDWRIARSSLQFMWPERHLTEGFPGPTFPGRD